MTIGTGIILENTIKIDSIELDPTITYANISLKIMDEYSLSDEIIEYFTQLDEK